MPEGTIEIYDETADVVYLFQSMSDADVFALTGQDTWSTTRPASPRDRHGITLRSLL